MELAKTLKSWGECLYRKAFDLREKVQKYLAEVLLSKYKCPQCEGVLQLTREQFSKCVHCNYQFDPTLQFQKCAICNSNLIKKTQHYFCPKCQKYQQSIFSLNNWIYHPAYFAQKMRKSREIKKKKKEAMRQLLAGARSPDILCENLNLNLLHGFEESLNDFLQIPIMIESITKDVEFKMDEYRVHIFEILPQDCLIHFEGISPLISNQNVDRIYRFITLIYMWHDREVNLFQEEGIIKVERI